MIIDALLLQHWVTAVFEKAGCTLQDAALAADVLVTADLRGIDSHGVARLSGYLRLQEAGRINMKPKMQIFNQALATSNIDADRGMGLVVAPKAMEIAIEKAQKTGIGWINIHNSNHFGIAAYHAMKALPHDMVGFAMTNASPLVVPTYGKKRMLGTNPICVAFPAKNHPPVVIDMATSAAANGKLEIAQRHNKAIPVGWVVDENGNKSTDPGILAKGGALLPLGSTPDNGSHKGYGLGAMVDLLTGVLGGASFGPWVPPFPAFLPVLPHENGKGLGHVVGAIRIDAFRPKNDYYLAIDEWISAFKTSPAQTNETVLVHGTPEHLAWNERTKHGFELNEKVYADLAAVSAKFGLEFKITK